MTELDEAMMKHMKNIVVYEKRAFCVLDLRRFEIDGKEYCMSSGTFRNKISMLAKEGKVEPQFRSGNAYYSIPGHKFSKSMTKDRIGVGVGVSKVGKQTPLYRFLKDRPWEKQSVHDIRLTFVARGLWNHVCSRFPIDGNNKDVSLPSIRFSDEVIAKLTIHHTDTVSVAIACSFRPFVIDIPDILSLVELMTRIELNIAKHCQVSDVIIPHFNTWIVKMWHFGWDSLDRYDGEKFHISFEEGIADLWRVYSKRMKDNKKIRAENQEYINKPPVDALLNRFYQDSYGEII